MAGYYINPLDDLAGGIQDFLRHRQEVPVTTEYTSLAVSTPTQERPSWDETWLRVAGIMAARSTCPRKHVGAVLVSPENRVLSTGYNGAPAGEPHCTDVGCLTDSEGHCIRALHAEMNAILGCTNESRGGIIYVTHFPCLACVLVLVQAGIQRLVCPPAPNKERYNAARRILDHQDVAITTMEVDI